MNILLGDDNRETETKDSLKRTAININSIHLNPNQPRKSFDQDRLLELSQSIKNLGQLVPIIVREHPNKKNTFLIIAGERRWRAAKIAGLEQIDVIIKNDTEKFSSLAAIIENVQREDLNPIEEGESYHSLIDEHGLTHEEISKFTGKSRSYISNFIRIVGLPEDIKELVRLKKLSFGHARALLASENRHSLAKIVMQKQLSVRQTEDLVKNEQTKKTKPEKNTKELADKDANISDYEKYLSLKLGFEVHIRDKNGKGAISVKYQNLDQLEEIISIFNQKK